MYLGRQSTQVMSLPRQKVVHELLSSCKVICPPWQIIYLGNEFTQVESCTQIAIKLLGSLSTQVDSLPRQKVVHKLQSSCYIICPPRQIVYLGVWAPICAHTPRSSDNLLHISTQVVPVRNHFSYLSRNLSYPHFSCQNKTT